MSELPQSSKTRTAAGIGESSLGEGEDVQVLWTGGWDSTFRILQLLADTRATIRPVYVIDPARGSTMHELRAIASLRRSIRDRIPESSDRLRNTLIVLLDEIPEDAGVTKSLAALRQLSHVGGQYGWLSRLALMLMTDRLELTVHRDDTAYTFVQHALEVREDSAVGPYYQVSPAASGGLDLFKPFRLPILDWTKLGMRDWAEQHGFADILAQTWFCHRPIAGRPCGECNPCCYTMREGLIERFPLSARVRYYLRRPRRAPALLTRRLVNSSARATRRILRTLRA